MNELRQLLRRYILSEIDYATFRPLLIRALSAGGNALNAIGPLIEYECSAFADGETPEALFKQRLADLASPSLAWVFKTETSGERVEQLALGTSTNSLFFGSWISTESSNRARMTPTVTAAA